MLTTNISVTIFERFYDHVFNVLTSRSQWQRTVHRELVEQNTRNSDMDKSCAEPIPDDHVQHTRWCQIGFVRRGDWGLASTKYSYKNSWLHIAFTTGTFWHQRRQIPTYKQVSKNYKDVYSWNKDIFINK